MSTTGQPFILYYAGVAIGTSMPLNNATQAVAWYWSPTDASNASNASNSQGVVSGGALKISYNYDPGMNICAGNVTIAVYTSSSPSSTSSSPPMNSTMGFSFESSTQQGSFSSIINAVDALTASYLGATVYRTLYGSNIYSVSVTPLTPGITGPKGIDGQNGETGPNGTNGTNGTNGIQGPTGLPGDPTVLLSRVNTWTTTQTFTSPGVSGPNGSPVLNIQNSDNSSSVWMRMGASALSYSTNTVEGDTLLVVNPYPPSLPDNLPTGLNIVMSGDSPSGIRISDDNVAIHNCRLQGDVVLRAAPLLPFGTQYNDYLGVIYDPATVDLPDYNIAIGQMFIKHLASPITHTTMTSISTSDPIGQGVWLCDYQCSFVFPNASGFGQGTVGVFSDASCTTHIGSGFQDTFANSQYIEDSPRWAQTAQTCHTFVFCLGTYTLPTTHLYFGAQANVEQVSLGAVTANLSWKLTRIA